MADTVVLETLVKYVDDYLEATKESRRISELCRHYYDGDQWTSEEIAQLKARNQPVVVNNRIQPMVDFLVGMEINARTDPKAFGRTPMEEADADAATDAIRFVQDEQKFDSTSTDVYEEFLIEGPSGCAVEWDKKKKKITARHVPYNRMIYDPHSTDRQMEDSRYKGIVTWMDIDDIGTRWGKEAAEQVDQDWRQSYHSGDTLEDTPGWYDSSRRRAMIIELYFKHGGKWHRAVFTRGRYLEDASVSAYKDQDGVPKCPFYFASPKIKRDGSRYGLVATRLSMQDAINKRHSKAIDLLTRKQTWSKKGSLDDTDKFKAQVNDSGGHIEFPPMGKLNDDFGFVENESLAGPQFEMYKDTISQLEAIKNGGMADANDSNLSGKALRTLQQGRSMEVAPIREVYHQWLIRVSTAMWEGIRQFWKEETWIRVTDDESNTKFVGFNRNKTIRDEIISQMGAVPPEVLNNPQWAARLDEVVRDESGKPVPMNKVASLDVDIIMEEVPDVLTLQQETFEKLVELYSANPEEVPFSTILEISPLPARWKRRLLEQPQMSPEQQQEQQQQKQMQDINAELELALKQAKTQKETAQAMEKEAAATQTQIENHLLTLYANSGQQPTQVNI